MVKVKQFPKDKGLDHTLELLNEGYTFIGRRTYCYQTDFFQTRLMGKKVICMTGVDGARIFYNPKLFERKGVMPHRVKETLIGKNSIQGLDGRAHKNRRALLMNFTTKEREKELIKLATKAWEEAIETWSNKDEVILIVEAEKILCKAACEWIGIPLPEERVEDVARALGEMVFGFGKLGIEHWKGRISRNKLEAWLTNMVNDIREGSMKVKHDTILYEMSHYIDETGNLLETKIVAVELLNLLRPIVAVAVYIAFMILALYENPAYKVKLALGKEEDRERFNEEVRRYYPFAPFIGAKVRKNFIWRDY
ncbi:MAG: cytochrome P450, partial [Cellulosilyticum sp.]|nr:cytochrome P450 [Cellulosilyticum sp.]